MAVDRRSPGQGERDSHRVRLHTARNRPRRLVLSARRLALRVLLASLAASLPALAPSARADEIDPAARLVDGLDLHQRVADGSLIVLATCEEADGKATLLIEDVLRSDFAELPKTIEVAYRGTNRMRDLGEEPFSIDAGERAYFVLEPWTDARGDIRRGDLFRPVGLARAKIPLPAEGAEALNQAIRAVIEYHDSPRRGLAEARLVDWLTGSNPWLIDVALDEAARFALAGPDWIEPLLARTRDVSPNRRLRAVQALGLALARGRLDDAQLRGREDGSDLVARVREALVRQARADEDPRVRKAAVKQLATSGVSDLAPLLESIARDDDDQDVRYTAAAALLELRR